MTEAARQSYKDIKTKGPDETRFNKMVSNNPNLRDPVREARMKEMGLWAVAQGALTEAKATHQRDKTEALLEGPGVVTEGMINDTQRLAAIETAEEVKGIPRLDGGVEDIAHVGTTSDLISYDRTVETAPQTLRAPNSSPRIGR